MLQNVSNLRKKDEPADKAEVPFSLSPVWMNVVRSSLENHVDFVYAFHVMTCMLGLQFAEGQITMPWEK